MTTPGTGDEREPFSGTAAPGQWSAVTTDQLRTERNNALAEVARLRDRLEGVDQTIGAFGAKNMRLMGEADALRTRIHALKAEVADWKQGCERALRDREATEAEMDTRLAAAWAERDAMRAVVEAAVAWAEMGGAGQSRDRWTPTDQEEALEAAVDSYQATPTTPQAAPTTDPEIWMTSAKITEGTREGE